MSAIRDRREPASQSSTDSPERVTNRATNRTEKAFNPLSQLYNQHEQQISLEGRTIRHISIREEQKEQTLLSDSLSMDGYFELIEAQIRRGERSLEDISLDVARQNTAEYLALAGRLISDRIALLSDIPESIAVQIDGYFDFATRLILERKAFLDNVPDAILEKQGPSYFDFVEDQIRKNRASLRNIPERIALGDIYRYFDLVDWLCKRQQVLLDEIPPKVALANIDRYFDLVRKLISKEGPFLDDIPEDVISRNIERFFVLAEGLILEGKASLSDIPNNILERRPPSPEPRL